MGRPHGLPVALMAEAIARAGLHDLSQGATGKSPARGPDQPLSCALCHAEHRGSEQPLSTLSDARCQACHQQRFDSFHDGHPDFGDWPHERPGAIAFDHRAHFEDHFLRDEGAQAGFDLSAPRCTDCHGPDERGETMQPRFDRHCQSCHGGKLEFQARDALVLLELPRIDEPPPGLGTWPTGVGSKTLKVGAPMRLMLGAAVADWTALPKSTRKRLRFAKLDGEELRRASTMAASLREVVLAARGQGAVAVRRQLSAALGLSGRQDERDGSVPGMALPDGLDEPALAEALARAGEHWFGGAVSEGAVDSTGYVFDPEEDQVLYHPTGHGDPVLAAWVELMARLHDREARDLGLEDAWSDSAVGAAYRACTQCHRPQREGDGAYSIAWDGRAQNELTRFLHTPHLGEPAPRDEAWPDGTCVGCHEPADPRSGAELAAGYTPGFEPIPKALCAECHGGEQDSAPANCLTCHRYHAGAWAQHERPR